MRLEGASEMAICAACGCSPDKRLDHRRSVPDSVSAGEQGAAAESDRRETGLPPRLLGRALRKQRSRWLRLTGSQRMRRVLFYGVAPVMLAVLPWMLGASSEDQIGACPNDGAPTAESVPAMLEDCGTVKKLDLTDQLSIAITIYAADENHGGQVDLRRQMGRLMRGLHQVAQCFPMVKIIRADLLAASENRHDEYGNALAGSEVPIVSLAIRTDDLRAFRQDFEWESYPVYAANRYARAINLKLSDVWHRELEKEEEIGDFVDSL
jgi:hypothetical protein